MARLLRAMAASEAVQARRLFNSLIGKVDISESYIATIFENEIQNILATYADLMNEIPSESPALTQVLSQLRAATIRLRSFYSRTDGDVRLKDNDEYSVCRFCGYLSTDGPPETCPVCGAPAGAFDEVA